MQKTIVCFFLLIVTTLAAPCRSMAAAPSARDFSRAAAVSSVSIARDGKHIVALTSPDGDRVMISVWRTDAMDKVPVTLASPLQLRFTSVRFLKNDRLLVGAIYATTMGAEKTHIRKILMTDLAGATWSRLLPEHDTGSEEVQAANKKNDPFVIDNLPLDPQNVLVEDTSVDGGGDIYKVNVYTGAAVRQEHGSDRFENVQADLKGQVRARQEINFDGGNIYIAQWIKNPATNAWEEHFRSYARDREIASIVGFTTDPNIIYLLTAKDHDRAGIYLYDIKARKIIEPAFEHRMFEAQDVITSVFDSNFGELLGFRYNSDRPSVYWVDGKFGALAKAIDAALGIKRVAMDWVDPSTGLKARISVVDGPSADIRSVSGDQTLAIVSKSGPGTPPEYYLYSADGKLVLLGRSRPWIDPSSLGATRMVEYTARDGLPIPAFLTSPPASFGAGPFPTLVLPHGGPWARDEIGWDASGWTQYFASRGYAVLQPQYRGSEGWGQKLWRAGDAQWGGTMQDDKDDAVKWLVAQNIAAPNRVAMFGYSYGGYAALVASIRPNGLYQCAISGAGAGDLAVLKNATFNNRLQREFQNPTIRGMNALDHATEAQIPVFLYHGDHDQIVDVDQSRKFAGALRAAGKPVKYLEIKDMGHTLDTMTPADLELQLVEIEKFLKGECKPGGL
jgi:dipeptidyl aminopeptidase/acylaminoacyl peptidase